jgi:hypothetical protein
MQTGSVKGRTFQIHKSGRDIQRPKPTNKEHGHESNGKAESVEKVDNAYFNDLFK